MIPAEWNAPVSSVVHSTCSSKLSSQESLKSTHLESWKCVGLDRVRALTKTHIHADTQLRSSLADRLIITYHPDLIIMTLKQTKRTHHDLFFSSSLPHSLFAIHMSHLPFPICFRLPVSVLESNWYMGLTLAFDLNGRLNDGYITV